jgi:replication fork clamp-binding protein CrfC
MIRNNKEFKTTQERIEYFQNLLLQLRVSATPEEFPLISSGYRAEIEKMQDDILEYLTRHSSEPIQSKAFSMEKEAVLA